MDNNMFNKLKQQIHQSKFNIDDIIDDTLKDSSSFQHIKDTSLMNIIKGKTNAGKAINNIINQAEKSINSIETTRLNIYRDYDDIMKKVPVVSNSISIFVDNIVTPDNNIDNVIRYHHSFTNKNSARIKEIISNFNLIKDMYELDNKLDTLAEHLLVYGDFFIEIIENQSLIKKYKILMESSSIKNDDNSEVLFETVTFQLEQESKNKTKISKKHDNIILTKNMFDLYMKTSENDSDKHIDEAKSLLESDNIDDKLYNLSKIQIKIHHPRNVMAIYSNDTILGYLVIKPTPGSLQPNEQIGQQILGQMFNYNKNDIKKIVENNPEYENYISALLRSYDDGIQEIQARFVHVDMMIHKSNSTSSNTATNAGITFPYGVSKLEPIRELAKYSIIGNRSTMLYRFTRAPDIRLFKVDIGVDRDAAKYIQDVKNNITKKKYSMDTSLDVDTLSKGMTQFDDLWIPTKQGQEFFSIDVTPSGDLQSKIDDLKFINDQIISGLGTPPIYLALDRPEDSRYTLSQQNAGFAKTISRVQKVVSNGLDRTMKIVYKMAFGSNPVAQSFKIRLNPPTALILERESEIYSNASTIMQSLESLKIPKEYFRRNLMSWLNFDEINDYEIEEKISEIEDKVSSDDGSDDDSGGDLF